MKNYKQLLEAINRGINLALDDFDDEEIISQKKFKQDYNKDYTQEYIDLMKVTVDMGLPSKTYWYKYNIGVEPDKLNVAMNWYGNYYAWGELEDKVKQRKDYIWDTYKFAKKDKYSNNVFLTKYCNKDNYGYDMAPETDSFTSRYKDNLIDLLLEDDIAAQTLHLYDYKIHIPTEEQFAELKEHTTKRWVNNYEYNGKIIKSLSGMVFKSKINGNEIFFPAAGEASFAATYDFGEYWSSSLFLQNPTNAYSMHIDNGEFKNYCCYIHANARTHGYSIRPVINIK